jgi:hypothetical protein
LDRASLISEVDRHIGSGLARARRRRSSPEQVTTGGIVCRSAPRCWDRRDLPVGRRRAGLRSSGPVAFANRIDCAATPSLIWCATHTCPRMSVAQPLARAIPLGALPFPIFVTRLCAPDVALSSKGDRSETRRHRNALGSIFYRDTPATHGRTNGRTDRPTGRAEESMVRSPSLPPRRTEHGAPAPRRTHAGHGPAAPPFATAVIRAARLPGGARRMDRFHPLATALPFVLVGHAPTMSRMNAIASTSSGKSVRCLSRASLDPQLQRSGHRTRRTMARGC